MVDDNNKIKKYVEKEFVGNQLSKWKSKAKEYVDDKNKARNLLEKAINKANSRRNKGPLDEIWDKIQILFSIIRDWIRGAYREVSYQTVIMIIVGLLYFVAPIDIMPDWLIGIGWIDDAFILGLIIRQLDSELKNYKKWKEQLIIEISELEEIDEEEQK